MLVRTGRGGGQAQIRGPGVEKIKPFTIHDSLLLAIMELRNLFVES
jgi:hypothetical protein